MRISSLFLTTLLGLVLAEDKVIVGYYVPWGKVLPHEIDYSKVTHINYGFGVLQNKTNVAPTDVFLDPWYDHPKIRELKRLANFKKVKVLMSLGGWTGSQTFSLIVRSADLRRKFIQEALKFLKAEEDGGFALDGIDLDWEYPNRKAAACNIIDKYDSFNYLILLRELRETMNREFPYEHKLLTAAVRAKPFDDENGNPLTDVRAFIPYFDFINIMAYDIMGSWSKTTGPNAPYRADINKGGDIYSFTQAIDEWLAAGFPANKLTAGLAGYGRSVTTNVTMDATTMYVTKDSVTPKGDESDANEINFFCNEGSYFSGVYKYKFLRKDILINGYNQATNGYIRYFDEVTQTPWLFNPTTKRFISYDDPQSIQVKVNYIKSKNLKGAMFWELSQDYNNELSNIIQQVKQIQSPINQVDLPSISPQHHMPSQTYNSPVKSVPVTESCSWSGPFCQGPENPRQINWCRDGKIFSNFCSEGYFCTYKNAFDQQTQSYNHILICKS